MGHALFSLRLVQVVTLEVLAPPISAALCSPNLQLTTQRLSHHKRLVALIALDIAIDKRGR
ncbi:hypothetical protein [Acidovorax delafieldii]|uniref:hypothetical protein n=1 Tax=Acidovorax delafieldii TaxID=47920 RepID=UPI003ECEEB98